MGTKARSNETCSRKGLALFFTFLGILSYLSCSGQVKMASLVSVLSSLFVRQVIPARLTKYGLPVPKVCHLVISPEQLRGKDVFVVGDVHGCHSELIQLLSEADVLHNDNAIVIFVGDLVNKGPHSVDVINVFKALGSRAFSVRGNNEEAVLREYFRLKNDSDYELRERYHWIRDVDDKDMEILNSLPYTVQLPSLNSIIVHAGIVPGKPLHAQKTVDMVDMRNLVQEDYFHGRGLFALEKTKEGVAWATLWPGSEHVYFGHDARRRLQLHPFASGIDTGCVYGGQLTGVFLTGQRKQNMLSVQSNYSCLKSEE